MGVGVVLPTSEGDLMSRGANARLRMSIRAHRGADMPLSRSIGGKFSLQLVLDKVSADVRHRGERGIRRRTAIRDAAGGTTA